MTYMAPGYLTGCWQPGDVRERETEIDCSFKREFVRTQQMYLY